MRPAWQKCLNARNSSALESCAVCPVWTKETENQSKSSILELFLKTFEKMIFRKFVYGIITQVDVLDPQENFKIFLTEKKL